ncbi:MAG: hypothetical protein F2605_00655, partial [Actinobacteria bacterium]|nr:hypothetical protein [Actinomycetota bacterium]
MTVPKILLGNPSPRNEQRYFRGKSMSVWTGFALVSNVTGWVANPRLELHLKRFKEAHADREPNQDEILEIMSREREFSLSELVVDIRENGVRTPVILSNSGVLLDGNRRFFAVRKLISETEVSDPKLSDYQRVPVIVLAENCTKEDEDLVLWHENFYPDLKKQWPDYVLATFISDRLEAGDTASEVAKMFGWSVAKVRDTNKIMRLINDFIVFATTALEDEGLGLPDLEGEKLASENYQFFNEAQKSFHEKIEADFEFKKQFFRWIYEGKFSSFQQVRVAAIAWENPSLREDLKSSDSEAAARVLAT